MADNVAGDYASLGGIEIVNTARTVAYLNSGLKPDSMAIAADCGCPGLIDLIGCDSVYVDPMTDDAPWYSDDHPESKDFAGFFVTEFEGMSSPFERSVNENIGNGGSLGRSRIASRTMTWKGFLLGANCCAVAYGFRWLAQTLRAAAADCGGCQGADLELLVCCPATDTTDDYGGYDEGYGPILDGPFNIEAFRTLKNVALAEGPIIVSERRTAGGCSGEGGGCGGSVIMEIEFSLVAANPFLFRAEVPIVNCIALSESSERVTVEEPDCPPLDCGQDLFETYLSARGCAVPDLPPVATYSIDCLEQPATLERALYITVPRTSWREFEEAVPYIVIDTGAFYLTDLQLGFYSSASPDPCGDLATNGPECDIVCDKLTILALPAESKLIIDGRTRTMSVVCSTNVAFPGERFTLGAFSWPVFSCYGFCIELAFSALNPENPNLGLPNLGNGCISVSVIPRSF